MRNNTRSTIRGRIFGCRTEGGSGVKICVKKAVQKSKILQDGQPTVKPTHKNKIRTEKTTAFMVLSINP